MLSAARRELQSAPSILRLALLPVACKRQRLVIGNKGWDLVVDGITFSLGRVSLSAGLLVQYRIGVRGLNEIERGRQQNFRPDQSDPEQAQRKKQK